MEGCPRDGGRRGTERPAAGGPRARDAWGGTGAEPRRTSDEPWTRTFLAQPVPFKPGTHFLYNTSATYMLSAIVQKATGQIENTARIRQIRRDVARIKTAQRSRVLAQAK